MRVRLNSKPTVKQQKIIKEECRKEFYNLLGWYNQQAAVQMLYVLHFEFGFGQARLEKFAGHLQKMQNDMVDFYEMDDGQTPWLCRKKLEQDGINVAKILKENEK